MHFLLATPPSSPASAGGPDMTRYLLVCALLLGLIALAAWLFRRFIGSSVRAKAAKRSLQIVDLLPLGGKQRLCVVRCYDRTFALGLGDKEVALIAELDAVIEPAARPRKPFAAILGAKDPHVGDPETTPTTPRRSLFPTGGLFG